MQQMDGHACKIKTLLYTFKLKQRICAAWLRRICNVCKCYIDMVSTPVLDLGRHIGTCLKPDPGTVTMPVSSSNSMQYRASGALPAFLAACARIRTVLRRYHTTAYLLMLQSLLLWQLGTHTHD